LGFLSVTWLERDLGLSCTSRAIHFWGKQGPGCSAGPRWPKARWGTREHVVVSASFSKQDPPAGSRNQSGERDSAWTKLTWECELPPLGTRGGPPTPSEVTSPKPDGRAVRGHDAVVKPAHACGGNAMADIHQVSTRFPSHRNARAGHGRGPRSGRGGGGSPELGEPSGFVLARISRRGQRQGSGTPPQARGGGRLGPGNLGSPQGSVYKRGAPAGSE